MRKIDKNTEALKKILNWQLEKYNLTIDSPEIRGDAHWFRHYVLTDDEFIKWKDYSIGVLRSYLRYSKIRAEKEFMWINLFYGLMSEKVKSEQIMKKVKVYVAGKLNDMAVDYIKNCHKMIKMAKVARNAGFSVYVPCIDFLEGLVDGYFGYEDYFENSQPWLMAADAILLVPGWETSSGTIREIELAKSKNIPVFFDVESMKDHFDSKKSDE